MALELTEKQTQVYEFLVSYVTKNHYGPTISDIADHFKIYPTAAHGHIKTLEQKGMIVRPRKGGSRVYQFPHMKMSLEFIDE